MNETNSFNEQDLERITKFKQQIAKMIVTSQDAYKRTYSREGYSNRIRKDYEKDEIQQIITSGSAVEQATLSKYFFSISGVYKRIILHYATFLTYSWVLVPHMKRKQDQLKNKKNKNIYYDASDFCSDFGIERQCTLFAKDVLVEGGYYGLIHDNGNSIAIQKLPFEYCRTRFKNQQDIPVIEFDMKFFDREIPDETLRLQVLRAYPACIQRGYRQYKAGKDPWIFIPTDISIYFNLFEERPFFLDLIPLIDDLEDYKEIDKNRNLLSLKRILTQEIPHDGLNLLFEPDEGAEMHRGAVDMMENNPEVDVLTSYNKINLLDLSGDADDKTEVTSAQQLIYDSAGVSKELFSATTEAGLQFSINNDLSLMMVLGHAFAHFFTALLNNKFGNKKMSFKLLILPISQYNTVEYTSKAKDLAAFGYSFLTPILSTGLDQTNLADLKELENEVLELDEVLKPLQSAYTQSGKTNAITAAAGKEQTKTQTQTQTKETSQPADNKSSGGEN